jgi:hypothetical protein
MILNLVPSEWQGKTGKPGTLPFDVIVFNCLADYKSANTERAFKKFIIAKFITYGDAFRYAHQLNTAPNPPYKIIIRA